MIYVRNIFFSFDQFLNTICGGDPDITISARVGYFSKIMQWNSQPKNLKKYYWKTSEKLIDWAWKPLDGPKHCWEAYLADRYEDYTSNNCWFFLFLISLIIIPICIVVGVILRLLSLFVDF